MFSIGAGHDTGACGGYIMSSVLPGGEHATEWSSCSRNVFQNFLANRYVVTHLSIHPFIDASIIDRFIPFAIEMTSGHFWLIGLILSSIHS